jgi:hypothetical protein
MPISKPSQLSDMTTGEKKGVKGTYPDNCLSKELFPGKSLFEAIFPEDSFLSLASLCRTVHQSLSLFLFLSLVPLLLPCIWSGDRWMDGDRRRRRLTVLVELISALIIRTRKGTYSWNIFDFNPISSRRPSHLLTTCKDPTIHQ